LSRKRPAELTRRKPSRWERERRRRYILEIVISIAIISVVALVTYGLYDSRIKPWHETVVRVNDAAFDMNYFVKLFRLYGGTGQNLEQDMQLAEMLPEVIENNELKKQGVEARGIYPTRQEIEDKFWGFMGSDPYQDDAEFFERYWEILDRYKVSDRDFKELIIAPMVIEEKLRQYMGNEKYPEDGEFDHVNVRAALFGTDQQALDARVDWEASGFESMINSTTPSLQYPPKGSDEEWLPRDIEDVDFDEFAFGEGTENIGLLSGPVHDTKHYTTGGYWLVMVVDERVMEGVEEEEKELYIKAILLDSKGKAEEVAAMYDGENFAGLAEEYSLDSASKGNGGDMGWMSAENAESRFTPAVLDLELNELSSPLYSPMVSKKSGYWIIEVLANEMRPLTESHRITLVGQLFNDWLEAERESDQNRIENLLDAGKMFWAIGHLDMSVQAG